MTVSHFGHHRMPEEFRRKWQNPESILHKIGLKPGDTFLDIGCGNGYFAIPAAKIVGDKGVVYGLDISREAIDELNNQAKLLGLTNIRLTTGDAEKVILCESCSDVAFLGIDLHDFDDPLAVLKNARRMLKPGGRLVDLDFKKIRMDFGPPYEKIIDEATAKKLLESAGFTIESVADIPPYTYLIIARPA